jgi:hypothetical protein
MTKTKTYAVEVELTEKQAQQLCDLIPMEMPDSQKIAGLALGALTDMAEGGLILNGSTVQQIVGVLGEFDPQSVVQAVENGSGIDQGCLVAKWRIDPTYEPVLREIAASQGVTLDQATQSLMDYGVAQGWGYQMSPDAETVFFTKEDIQMIREVLEKEHATGTDIAAFIRKTVDVPEFDRMDVAEPVKA